MPGLGISYGVKKKASTQLCDNLFLFICSIYRRARRMKKSSMIFFGFTHTKKSFSHELKFSSQSESIIVSPPPQHVPVEFLISQGTHTHSDTRTHTRRLWEKIPKQSISAMTPNTCEEAWNILHIPRSLFVHFKILLYFNMFS